MKNILCKLGLHKWENIERHFYAEATFGNHFIKHWQIEKKCKRCNKTQKPAWFNHSWRIEHPLLEIAFLDIEWPAYFNVKEYDAYKKTVKALEDIKKIL